jgi:hypothetical protein
MIPKQFVTFTIDEISKFLEFQKKTFELCTKKTCNACKRPSNLFNKSNFDKVITAKFML